VGFIGEKQQIVARVFEDMEETEAPLEVIPEPAPAIPALQA
jgi:hypothetical protein